MQLGPGVSYSGFTNWGATLFAYFDANVTGNSTYTFYVASDNGAQLYLDSTLLIDNSGTSISSHYTHSNACHNIQSTPA